MYNKKYGRSGSWDKPLAFIFLVIISIILGPMIVLRENYIFTVHDYLDSWPSLFEVLRRGNLFWAPDSPMPILNGMSTCYLYFDFGIYRWLNFLFGFVWGEIINKFLAIFIGYVSMNHMLQFVLKVDGERNIKLLALAYAISPVYPVWSISFAILPLLLEIFIRYCRNPKVKISFRMMFFLLFGFGVYFPTIGIFVLGIWFLGFCVELVLYKRVNLKLLISLLLMSVSSIVFNINIFIYLLRGDALNRSLKIIPDYPLGKGLYEFIIQSTKAFLVGQYHAKPVYIMIVPVSLAGMAVLFFKRKKITDKKDKALLKMGIWILILIVIFSAVRGLDEVGVLPYIFSKILPVLQGFNFGRMMYFNNILWYILFGIVLVSFQGKKLGKIIFCILLGIQFLTIILSNGYYQDTRRNLFYEKSLAQGNVTYKEFYAVKLFSEIKEHINYQCEGVVSVGIDPAVAMYNGFNTLDGYLCVCPLEYHAAFRNIIAPELEKDEDLRKYYDTWGGRIYVYCGTRNMPVTREKNLESRDLDIDVSAFEAMGGKYILSRYIITNAEDLGITLVGDFDDTESIYHVFVYLVEQEEWGGEGN